MSYSLNSLKGGHLGDYIGDYHRVIQGDTRSLDYSSYIHNLFLVRALGLQRSLLTPSQEGTR